MKKKIIFGFLAGIIGCTAWAQTSPFAEVVKGDSAEIRILSGAFGGTVYDVSANGRYMVGSLGNTSGFLYDVQKDSVTIFNDGSPKCVADNGIILGNFLPDDFAGEEPTMNDLKGGLYKNGQWYALEEIPGNPGRIVAYGLSSDGEVAAGYGYVVHPNGSATYAGVVFDDTKIRNYLLHPDFPYPGDDDPSFSGEGYEGWGARMNTLSGDGSVAVGFGTKPPFGSTAARQRTPHLWVLSADKAEAHYVGEWTGDMAEQSGEISHANHDGSIAVGTYGSKGAVWTKNDTGYAVSYVGTVNGYSGSALTGISETGIYVGYASTGQSDRAPIIYTPGTGLIRLEDFLRELYGLDASAYDLNTPMDISADGKCITGWGYRAGARFSYFIMLKNPVLSRPMKVKALQVAETFSVNVTWNEPMDNGRAVLGYDVYRDGVKVNTERVETMEFLDTEVPEGRHTYTIKAIYAEGESKYSDGYAILVLRPGGCYPVQRIGNRVVYNREFSLYWGLPSSEINLTAAKSIAPVSADADKTLLCLYAGQADMGAAMKSDAKYVNETHFDYVSEINLQAVTSYAFVDYRGSYYTSDWRVAMMTEISHEGEFVRNITIPDLPLVRDMTVVADTALWVACGNRIIYWIDVDNKIVRGQKRLDIDVEHLSWIPELNDGKGGFEVGNFETSLYVDMDGKKISDGIPVKKISSTAYYDGRLYAALQTGKYNGQLAVFDVKTRQQIGETVEVAEIPEVLDMNVPSCASAGLGISVLPDSTVCLGYVAQLGGAKANRAFLLEIESMPKLSGYNVYKNGVRVNEEPLASRVYTESIDEAGEYTWYVTAQFGDCESAASDTVGITIYDKGICHPVKRLEAEEINGQVFLTYEAPEEGSTGSLVGLNLYRNGEKLNEEFFPYLYFTDTSALPLGSYRYCIEAFYDNSCRAFDTVEIQITHEGYERPVSALKAESRPAASGASDKADVDLSWNLPWFESPYPLRWGNPYVANVIGIPGYTEYTLAIGWDSVYANRYRDYKIAGVEFFLYDKVNSVRPIVLVNEELVRNEECRTYETNNFTTYMFAEPVSLENAWEFMVGYTVNLEDGATVIGLAEGPLNYGYGNWISLKPEEPSSWQVLGVENNYAIAALLVRERMLDNGEKAEEIVWVNMPVRPVSGGTVGNQVSAVFDASVNREPVSGVIASKNNLVLAGFNVYRDEEKLNTEVLSNLRYLDTDLDRKSIHEYKVGTVYSNGNELFTESILIDLSDAANEETGVFAADPVSVWPNPAIDYLMVEAAGEFCVLSELSGRPVHRAVIGSTDARQVTRIDVADLPAGVYILSVFGYDGTVRHCKVVIR